VNHNFLAGFGSKGTGNGQFAAPTGDPADFTSPMGVAVDRTTDNIVVSDGGNSRVEIFSSTGQFLNTFGSFGTPLGQFQTPLGVDADPTTCNLVVDDYGNYRVEIFGSTAPAQLPVAVTGPAMSQVAVYRPTITSTVSNLNCGQGTGNGTATVSFEYGQSSILLQQPAAIAYTATVPTTPASLTPGAALQQGDGSAASHWVQRRGHKIPPGRDKQRRHQLRLFAVCR